MKRAVVVYLECKRSLMMQFACLYTSFKFVNPKDTDLVVFGTKEAHALIPNDCIKVEYNPLSEPKKWLEHRYINSISCFVGEAADFLDSYDYILKSDVDTFLTPSFKSYFPENYCVGKGGYVYTDEVKQRIKHIAKRFNLRHQGIHNIGSTQYGRPQLLKKVCALSVMVANHIMFEEFKDGPGDWPGWYQGVTLMYSGEIAVNHFIENICLDIEKLDYDSTSSNSIFEHPHIHCWHNDNMFSKFKFVEGSYDKLDITNIKLDKIKDYCLYIALKSRRDMPWLGEC